MAAGPCAILQYSFTISNQFESTAGLSSAVEAQIFIVYMFVVAWDLCAHTMLLYCTIPSCHSSPHVLLFIASSASLGRCHQLLLY